MQLSLGKVRLLAIALLVFAMASAATATSAADKAVPPDPTEDPVLMTAGFLSAHPDLKYRLMGLDEYRKGNLDDALQFFRRSAFYGDKASQGMVAEMLWTAQGVAQDRPLAYAWMDLAAERGYVDQVIYPHQTRSQVIRFLRVLRTKREALPPKKHGNIPL